MSRKFLVPFCTIAGILALGVITLAYFAKQSRSVVLVIPVKAPVVSVSDSHSLPWRKRITAHVNQIKDLESQRRTMAELEIITEIKDLVNTSSDLLADSDLGSTVGKTVTMLSELAITGNDVTVISDLCLELRWSPIRLHHVVDACAAIFADGRFRQGDPVTQRVHSGIAIFNPDEVARSAVNRFLSNPYEGEPLYRISSWLVEHGRFSEARALRLELLQIDINLATQLESEIAKASGVKHESHALPY